MQPYQERVVTEKKELDEKIARLKSFIEESSTLFKTLVLIEEQVRLHRQYAVMLEYSNILGERIQAFSII